MNWILYSFYFITGCAFGSFFYTLAVRLVDQNFSNKKLAILVERSRCPFCMNTIRPIYLFPVIGYFLAKGRCRDCLRKISPAYPVAEAVSGVLLVLMIYLNGISLLTTCEYFFIMTALAIAVSDARSMTIPDPLVFTLFLFSLYPVFMSGEWKSSLIAAAIGGGFFLIIALIFPGGFGGGDVKLGAAVGFFLGTSFTIVALESALITGAIFGVIYALISKKGLRIKIPFAPFMVLGLVVSYFFGNEILVLYYSIF